MAKFIELTPVENIYPELYNVDKIINVYMNTDKEVRIVYDCISYAQSIALKETYEQVKELLS